MVHPFVGALFELVTRGKRRRKAFGSMLPLLAKPTKEPRNAGDTSENSPDRCVECGSFMMERTQIALPKSATVEEARDFVDLRNFKSTFDYEKHLIKFPVQTAERRSEPTSAPKTGRPSEIVVESLDDGKAPTAPIVHASACMSPRKVAPREVPGCPDACACTSGREPGLLQTALGDAARARDRAVAPAQRRLR